MTPGNRSSMNASSLHKIAWCFWSWKTQAIHGGKHAYTEVYQTPRLGRQPSWSVDLGAQAAALRWQASEVVVQRLLLWGRREGIRPQLLLLDSGFYSVAVIGCLMRVPGAL